MSAKIVSFYTRNADSFVLDAATSTAKKYVGADRRLENRRQGGDRRVDVRFNLTKQDRRGSMGRRTDDVLPKFW